MGDGIGLRAGGFEAEPEESADAALARALETHGEVLLAGERFGRQRVYGFMSLLFATGLPGEEPG
jgi:hypothetical protein